MVDENSTFGGFLTDIGEAQQANANALQVPWKLTHMLLGDAGGTDPVPDPAQTGLINQRYRAAINQLFVDPANPAILTAELVLPPDVGGWWIRELGLEDDAGNFVAVANCAPSYKPLLAQGSGRNQVVRMHLIVSNTANVELKIDPSIVLATRAYVDDEITEHEQATEAHDASQIALAEALANFVGAGNVQAVLAALGTAAKLGKADSAQAQNHLNDTHALTPASLIAGVLGTGSLSGNGYAAFPYRDIVTGERKQMVIQLINQSGATGQPISFPIAFPTEALAIAGLDFSGGGADSSIQIMGYNNLTATSVNIYWRTDDGSTPPSSNFSAIIIGH